MCTKELTLFCEKAETLIDPDPNHSSNADSLLSSDGSLRHCITRATIGSAVRTFTGRSHFNVYPLSSVSEDVTRRKDSFKKIFDNGVWVGGKRPSLDKSIQASGTGSTLRAAHEVMATIHVLVDQIKTRFGLSRVRMLDIPCGDMAWMSRLLKSRNDIDYVGFDIVPDLIENHRKLYTEAHPNWQFYNVDVVSDGINSSLGYFNFVLSRHMLQHLTTADAIRVLMHISDLSQRSPMPVYLLTTTWSRYSENKDVNPTSRGRVRPLNLELPPFSLEPPLCLVNDGVPGENLCCYIGLWSLPLTQVDICQKEIANKVSNSFGFPGKLYSCTDWSLR